MNNHQHESPTVTVRIFYYYSGCDEDRLLKNTLDRNIRNIPNVQTLGVDNLPLGYERPQVIKDHLASDDILCLLISPDFEDLDEEKMQIVSSRRQEGRLHVIPIMLRHFLWLDPFGDLQRLPTQRGAIKSWPDLDEAGVHVANEMRSIISKVQHLKSAFWYESRKNYEKSQQEYRQALHFTSTNKEKADIWRKIADVRRRAGQWASVVDAYEQVTNFAPNDAQTYVTMGELHHQQLSDLKSACDAYAQAITLNPQDIELYKTTCALLLQSEQLDKALETCEAAIAQTQDNTQLMRYKAQILCERGEYQAACKIYKEKVLPLDPDNAYLYKEYGDALLKIGSKLTIDAIHAYDDALRISTKSKMNDSLFLNELNIKLQEAKRQLNEYLNKVQTRQLED